MQIHYSALSSLHFHQTITLCFFNDGSLDTRQEHCCAKQQDTHVYQDKSSNTKNWLAGICDGLWLREENNPFPTSALHSGSVMLLHSEGNLNQLLQISRTWAGTKVKPPRVTPHLAVTQHPCPNSSPTYRHSPSCLLAVWQGKNSLTSLVPVLTMRRKARYRSHNNNSVTRSPISTS